MYNNVFAVFISRCLMILYVLVYSISFLLMRISVFIFVVLYLRCLHIFV